MVQVVAQRDLFYAGARRDLTRKAYASGQKSFVSFIARFGLPDLVGNDQIINAVSLFAAYLALRGLAYGTIDGYVHGIQAFYMDFTVGALNIRSFYLIQQVLAGIKQRIGNLPKPKFALLPEFLLAIKVAMAGHPTDKRDWAMLVFAFWGLLCKSEILKLTWGDISVVDRSFRLWILDSKTDRDRKGMFTTLAFRGDDLCPHKAFCTYASTVPESLRIQGMKFALVSKKKEWEGKGLASSSFVGRIKHWVQTIGLDPSNYSGHSLRRGGATAMSRAGVPHELIQVQGRWKSDAYKLYLQLGAATLARVSSFAL